MNERVIKIGEKQNKYLVCTLEDKKVVWLSEINKYLVVEPVVAEIVIAVLNGDPVDTIIELSHKQFKIDKGQIANLIEEIQSTLSELLDSSSKNAAKLPEVLVEFTSGEHIERKYYKIYNVIFFVEYETSRAVEINHPKFSNFEIQAVDQFDHHIKVFHQYNTFSLQVNGKNRGTWNDQDDHFLGGKFSMEILQQLYRKEENEWLGVFHAAGISDGEKCILFLGDSGNGKSTLSALLMAAGFDVLSDDFLPVEASANLVCRFPAAISVKKTAYEIISEQFPQLLQFKEYNNPVLNKTFRYLPVPHIDMLCVPCRALVFVKYSREGDLKFEKMPQAEAFQHLVPDTWISPKTENSQKFVEWFKRLPCYRLTYSNNKTMVETVTKLFDDLS